MKKIKDKDKMINLLKTLTQDNISFLVLLSQTVKSNALSFLQ